MRSLYLVGAMLTTLPTLVAADSVLSSKVTKHVQAATTACAEFFTSGQDLSVLENVGFDRVRQDYVWDTRVPSNTRERMTVTATTESGKCNVQLSRATRQDSRDLNDIMTDAFVRRGFKVEPVASRRFDLTSGDQKLRLVGFVHKKTDVQSASVTVYRR
ncbi:hypothetical protein ACG74X_20830 [Marivita sp. S0852]|uniref:hypothetical protein n=1 Tax=Marivita sp. S0852 TaxID=3373893 RepID=UPI0039822457